MTTWKSGPGKAAAGAALLVGCFSLASYGEGADAADCARYRPLAPPAALASTPRADEEAELLAIEATSELVAPERIYQRARRDLAAIRAAHPAVRDLRAAPDWSNSLLVRLNGGARESVRNNNAVACLNRVYNAKAMRPLVDDMPELVVIEFKGRYNIPVLAREYARQPGVSYAEPDSRVGDGDDVCLSIAGDRYHYIFDEGAGDCPAGCTSHTYWGFSTTPDGTIQPLGMFSPDRGPGSESRPGWFADLDECRQWL
ncbi:hypothetical protein WME89_25820 [Sorangium sp. So ce321]|uniref:hypothetical protein n=1 Tax=Sorangium sp. So ce321 TaxID=3133300 RepID=UPI003F604877